MPRPDRIPPGPGLRRLGVALLCAAALTSVLSACTGAPEAATRQQQPAAAPAVPGAPAAPSVPAKVSYGMPADVSALILPTSGEGTRSTQGLDAFARLAAAWAVHDCARKRGETVPDGPPPMFTRLFSVPDLDYLRAHGFGEAVDVPGAPPRTPSSAQAPAEPGPELRTCLAEGRTAGQELPRVYQALQARWFEELAPLAHDPEVLRAREGFPGCLAAHDVRAEDENAFFALVDARLQAADAQGGRRLGAVYATCMAPVEAVREPLRKQLAERFRAEHRAEIATVVTELPKRVRELEQRYRIRFSVPAL
ncbi:hypothetical protein [Streptomyces sp. NPDC001930]|uniref:hypothetical protein n=1 Tax=Streptomyces sp. NPDC001930 TaxID=3364625 RepID=UPI0036924BBE